jgi:hypothetical protein
VAISGLMNQSTRGSGCGLDGPAAAALSSSTTGRWARTSSSRMLDCTGFINGDDALLVGQDAKRQCVSEARGKREEAGDSVEVESSDSLACRLSVMGLVGVIDT